MCRTILRRTAVTELTGLSPATIRRLVQSKSFPSPVLLTPGGSVGFYADDIKRWVDSRPPVTPEMHAAVTRNLSKRPAHHPQGNREPSSTLPAGEVHGLGY